MHLNEQAVNDLQMRNDMTRNKLYKYYTFLALRYNHILNIFDPQLSIKEIFNL